MFVEHQLHYVLGNHPLIFSLDRNKAGNSPCSLQFTLCMPAGKSKGVGEAAPAGYVTLVMSETATME